MLERSIKEIEFLPQRSETTLMESLKGPKELYCNPLKER